MADLAGWPSSLPRPESPEFDERVVGWLLDRGPADLRGTSLVTSPLLLAYVVLRQVEGSVDALRSSYGGVRADLGDIMTPEALQAGQQAMEKAGSGLSQQAREVALVFRAIRLRSPRLR